jgi:hypothetical protein
MGRPHPAFPPTTAPAATSRPCVVPPRAEDILVTAPRPAVPACTACANINRSKIDAALASGRSIRDVAAQYGLARSSVHRHHTRHRAKNLALAVLDADYATDSASSIAQRMLALSEITHRLAMVGAARGDGRLALQAITAEARQLDRLIHRLGVTDRDVLDEVESLSGLWRSALLASKDDPLRLRDMAGHLERQARRTGSEDVAAELDDVRAWCTARARDLERANPSERSAVTVTATV